MQAAHLLILILALSIVDLHVSATKTTNDTNTRSRNTSAMQTTNATTTRISNISATKPTNVTYTLSRNTSATEPTNAILILTSNKATMETTNATRTRISNISATKPTNVTYTLSRNTSATTVMQTLSRNSSAMETTNATTTRTSNISEPTPKTSKTPVQPIISENTRKQYIKEIDLDQTKAELELSVSVPVSFNEDLRKKNSEHYIKLEYEFKQQLTGVFKLIPGFLSIDILQFVNGSVVADLMVNFRPDMGVIQNAIKFIVNNASALIKDLNISGQHPMILQRNSYFYQLEEDASKGSLCSFLAPTTCTFGYICQQSSEGGIYCEDRCDLNRTFCHNDGECYVDHRDGKLKCRCLDTNSDYYFSGENCELIKPKGNSAPSSLSVKDYAIIGGVAAVGIVVVIVLFLGGRTLRKACVDSKDNDTEKDDESFRSNISVTHASVHMSHMDGSNQHERHGIDNTAHVFDSGLPQVTTNDQKLYRDSQTNRDSQAKHEAFIYQPTNVNGPLSSSSKEIESPEIDRKPGHTYYNVIDFEQNDTNKRPSNKNSRNVIL